MTAENVITSADAFIVRDGKVLVALRSADDDFLPGYWELVGGGVEPGETPEDAVVREVKEETGLTVNPIERYYDYSFVNEKGWNRRATAFTCELMNGDDVVLSCEHQVFRWINVDELGALTPVSDRMRDVIEQGFKLQKHTS